MKTLNSKLAVMAAIVLGSSLPALAVIGPSFSNPSSDGILYTATYSGQAVTIPDNNESGVAFALNFGALGLVKPDSVTVTLNISGGYNGDLTVYLSHGAGIAYLLQMNQNVSSSGLDNVIFNTTASAPVPTGSAALTGPYLPASGSLTAFNGLNANGNWTLFFADRSPGDTSTLNGFSVTAAVPEPVNVALGVFGGLLVVGGFVRNRAAVGKFFRAE